MHQWETSKLGEQELGGPCLRSLVLQDSTYGVTVAVTAVVWAGDISVPPCLGGISIKQLL